MSSRVLHQAGAAFRQGSWREVATLLSAEVLQETGGVVADRLRVVRAVSLVRAGDPKGALATLAEVSPDAATRPVVCRIRAAAEMALGDVAGAESALAPLRSEGDAAVASFHGALAVRRGLLALERGDAAAAREALRAARISSIQDEPTRYSAWLGLMIAAAGAGKPEEVPDAFALFPVWSRNPAANLVAARAAVALRDAAAAEAHLRAAARLPEAATQWWGLCRELFRARRLDDVIAHARAFLDEVAPPAGAARSGEHARAIGILLAFSLLLKGRPGDGRCVVQQLGQQRRGDDLVAYYAAVYALVSGRSDDLDAHLPRARRGRPLVPLLRAAHLLHEGRFTELRAALDGLRTRPTGWERETIRLIIAIACARLGDTQRAIDVLREVDEEQLPIPTRRSFTVLRGYLSLVRGHYALAARALEQTPLGPLARLEHARRKADLGNVAEALDDLRSLANHPKLAKVVARSRERMVLQRAIDAARSGALAEAEHLLASTRREGPDGAQIPALLEDLVHVGAAARSEDPARGADRLASLARDPPAGFGAAQTRTRRRDLFYLAALLNLQAAERGGPATAERRARAVAALEGCVEADAAFAPAAAILGVVLHHAGVDRRPLELLEFAARQLGGIAAVRVALGAEYVRIGRSIQAKGIFFSALAGPERSARAMRELCALLVQEQASSLRRAPPPAADGDDVDDAADVDPTRHAHLLLHRIKRRYARAPHPEPERRIVDLEGVIASGDSARTLEVVRAATRWMAEETSHDPELWQVD